MIFINILFNTSQWRRMLTSKCTIIYFVSLVDYDKMLYENGKTLRMIESLDLFEEVVNDPMTKDYPFLLIMNMNDLFTEKIQKINLKKYFSDYCGDENIHEAKLYLVKKFLEKNRICRKISIYFLNSLNSKQVKNCFLNIGKFVDETPVIMLTDSLWYNFSRRFSDITIKLKT